MGILACVCIPQLNQGVFIHRLTKSPNRALAYLRLEVSANGLFIMHSLEKCFAHCGRNFASYQFTAGGLKLKAPPDWDEAD